MLDQRPTQYSGENDYRQRIEQPDATSNIDEEIQLDCRNADEK